VEMLPTGRDRLGQGPAIGSRRSTAGNGEHGQEQQHGSHESLPALAITHSAGWPGRRSAPSVFLTPIRSHRPLGSQARNPSSGVRFFSLISGIRPARASGSQPDPCPTLWARSLTLRYGPLTVSLPRPPPFPSPSPERAGEAGRIDNHGCVQRPRDRRIILGLDASQPAKDGGAISSTIETYLFCNLPFGPKYTAISPVLVTHTP
jgi:hypothetical protein